MSEREEFNLGRERTRGERVVHEEK